MSKVEMKNLKTDTQQNETDALQTEQKKVDNSTKEKKDGNTTLLLV